MASTERKTEDPDDLVIDRKGARLLPDDGEVDCQAIIARLR
ncbi:MAG: hypothetical protein ACPGZP_08465 [Panacagrimonas sp.]